MTASTNATILMIRHGNMSQQSIVRIPKVQFHEPPTPLTVVITNAMTNAKLYCDSSFHLLRKPDPDRLSTI
jgi:hypothetical protein